MGVWEKCRLPFSTKVYRYRNVSVLVIAENAVVPVIHIAKFGLAFI